jgi:hypothetical protein
LQQELNKIQRETVVQESLLQCELFEIRILQALEEDENDLNT